jgi:methionine-rich copper-binding protein CopC
VTTLAPRASPTLLCAVALFAASALGASMGTERAAAHGLVLESSPKDQETVAAPSRLVIRFNSRLEKHLCSVRLVGPAGSAVRLQQDAASSPPDVLVYPLPALTPGAYQARWKVLSADGHVTEGVLRFTVDRGQGQR